MNRHENCCARCGEPIRPDDPSHNMVVDCGDFREWHPECCPVEMNGVECGQHLNEELLARLKQTRETRK